MMSDILPMQLTRAVDNAVISIPSTLSSCVTPFEPCIYHYGFAFTNTFPLTPHIKMSVLVQFEYAEGVG